MFDSDAACALLREIKECMWSGQPIKHIRVTDDALLGSMVAAPCLNDRFPHVYEILVHPDDWREVAMLSWAEIRKWAATDGEELPEEPPGPDGCRFYGVEVTSGV